MSPKLAVCKKLKLCFVVTEEYADRYAETSTAATTKSSTLGEFVENIQEANMYYIFNSQSNNHKFISLKCSFLYYKYMNTLSVVQSLMICQFRVARL